MSHLASDYCTPGRSACWCCFPGRPEPRRLWSPANVFLLQHHSMQWCCSSSPYSLHFIHKFHATASFQELPNTKELNLKHSFIFKRYIHDGEIDKHGFMNSDKYMHSSNHTPIKIWNITPPAPESCLCSFPNP